MLKTFTEGTAALRLPTLVLAMDEPTFAAARQTTAAAVLLPSTLGAGMAASPVLQRKWGALAEVLEAGAAVLWADVDAVLASDPFPLLAADSDVEALSEGWDELFLRGHVMGADDPSMGWSRYCESMRAAWLSSSLVYLEPTEPSRNLALQLAAAAAGWKPCPDGLAWADLDTADESAALSFELLMPAHDGTARVGAKLRVMHADCWLHERSALSRLPRLSQRPAALLPGRARSHSVDAATQAECRQRTAFAHYHRAQALGSCWQSSAFIALPPVWTLERTRVDPLMGHPLRINQTKQLVLGSRCRRVPASPSSAKGRRLNWLVPPSSESWPVRCDEQPGVCDAVRAVHRDRAVMLAVSNRNILHMLGQFIDTVQRVGVSNFMVVALDQSTGDFLARKRVAHYVRPLRSRSGSTDNHATSGLKFRILAEVLSVGASVLLTDVDVVLTQDPFPALYRDSDVEGMSDGWDDDSGYGHVHELPLQLRTAAVPDGAQPASAPLRSVRMAARNSGLFYLSATHEAVRLMEILSKRMASEDVWDQSAYNMEVFRPAYAQYESAGVSLRSMNYLCFCNTKLVFKYMRYDAQLIDPAQHLPVTVHINYHPEKEARMDSVARFYHQHEAKSTTLDRWNNGEGPRTGSCRGKVGVQTNSMPALTPRALSSHVLASNVANANEPWEWHGSGPVRFESSGALTSPWGAGSWGAVPSPWRKDSLHIVLNGETYLLMFLSEKWAFVAVRCSDEQVSYGRLQRPDVPKKRLVF